MARKSNSTILPDELYSQAGEARRDEEEDQRLLDLDVEEESPFLRAQKRISARRGALPKKAATGLTWLVIGAAAVFLGGMIVAAVYHYGEHSWRFRVDSSDDIEIAGLHNVSRQQVMEVMGGDIGRNIFFIPLAERQKQLEQIAWVESASVMRFVPNRLRIELHERTPAAFARVGSKILLIDAGGTLMDLPVAAKKKYSFPVILGMNSSEPHSSREARMKVYNELAKQLDSGGAHYTQDVSEVDLSDVDDVKVMANDPGGQVLVHLGSSDFLDRYKIFVSHVREWRQQFAKLDSVDLRYDNQIVVNPDLRGIASAAPVSPAAEKPAALITKEGPAAKASAKAGAKSRAEKAHRHKAAMKPANAQVKPAASGTAPAVQGPVPAAQGGPQKPAGVQSATQGSTAPATGSKPSPAIPKGPGQ
jgi:cell division protein FtsQ